MKWDELSQQSCPVARGCSVIGDRWTLLVLRDAFRGARRFEQFQESLGITRHVLADRLRKLESAGVLDRRQYQERPPRWEYRLTEAGLELQPVIITLVGWADRHRPAPDVPPMRYVSRATGETLDPVLVDRRTGEEITPRSIRSER